VERRQLAVTLLLVPQRKDEKGKKVMIKKNTKVTARRRGRLPDRSGGRSDDKSSPSKQLPPESQIQYPDGETTPPDWLSVNATAKWNELAPLLSDQGLLQTVDRDALSVYCDSYADVLAANAILARDGIVQENGRGGYTAHPAQTVKNHATAKMKVLALEFGLTPAARSRVVIDESETEDQSLKAVFGD